MRILTSISFLYLILVSCRVQSPPTAQNIPVPFISNAGKSLVYRASFNYKDYHFSGLCVFKKSNEQDIRVVFLNEMGITFMDFELKPREFVVHKMMPQLDKKILLNFLENDFRQLLMTDLFSPAKIRSARNEPLDAFHIKNKIKATYYVGKESGNIDLSIRKGFLGVKKASVKYKYGVNNIPTEIMLIHHQVKMNLKLTLLEKI